MAYFKHALLGIGLIFFVGSGAVHGAESTAKIEAIDELLRVTRLADNLKTVTSDSVRFYLDKSFSSKPNIPEEVKEKSYRIVMETFNENLPGLTVPIVELYEQTFTLEEIQELTTFYKSPLGQKLVRETPVIVQKSMMIGNQWGQKIAAIAMERIRKELASKGYDI